MKNVPVISPLYQDVKPYANLYQTIPTNEIKDAMFDYMRTKNGNIIAVDKKKSLSCST
jgi:hypothetical protein